MSAFIVIATPEQFTGATRYVGPFLNESIAESYVKRTGASDSVYRYYAQSLEAPIIKHEAGQRLYELACGKDAVGWDGLGPDGQAIWRDAAQLISGRLAAL